MISLETKIEKLSGEENCNRSSESPCHLMQQYIEHLTKMENRQNSFCYSRESSYDEQTSPSERSMSIASDASLNDTAVDYRCVKSQQNPYGYESKARESCETAEQEKLYKTTELPINARQSESKQLSELSLPEGNPCCTEESLDQLVKKFRTCLQDNSAQAISVKQLRHVIPMLIMATFDCRPEPMLKKVKGMWTSPPDGWPPNVPFCDPNNGQKVLGKPRKEVLMKMFTYLINLYAEVYGLSSQGDSKQIRSTPDKSIPVPRFYSSQPTNDEKCRRDQPRLRQPSPPGRYQGSSPRSHQDNNYISSDSQPYQPTSEEQASIPKLIPISVALEQYMKRISSISTVTHSGSVSSAPTTGCQAHSSCEPHLCSSGLCAHRALPPYRRFSEGKEGLLPKRLTPQERLPSPESFSAHRSAIFSGHSVTSPVRHSVTSPTLRATTSPTVHSVTSPTLHSTTSLGLHSVTSPTLHSLLTSKSEEDRLLKRSESFPTHFQETTQRSSHLNSRTFPSSEEEMVIDQGESSPRPKGSICSATNIPDDLPQTLRLHSSERSLYKKNEELASGSSRSLPDSDHIAEPFGSSFVKCCAPAAHNRSERRSISEDVQLDSLNLLHNTVSSKLLEVLKEDQVSQKPSEKIYVTKKSRILNQMNLDEGMSVESSPHGLSQHSGVTISPQSPDDTPLDCCQSSASSALQLEPQRLQNENTNDLSLSSEKSDEEETVFEPHFNKVKDQSAHAPYHFTRKRAYSDSSPAVLKSPSCVRVGRTDADIKPRDIHRKLVERITHKVGGIEQQQLLSSAEIPLLKSVYDVIKNSDLASCTTQWLNSAHAFENTLDAIIMFQRVPEGFTTQWKNFRVACLLHGTSHVEMKYQLNINQLP